MCMRKSTMVPNGNRGHTIYISPFSCLGKLLLLISALTINRSDQQSLTDRYYDYHNYFTVSGFPVTNIQLIGAYSTHSNTLKQVIFWMKIIGGNHSSCLPIIYCCSQKLYDLDRHGLLPNKSTLRKVTNTSPVRLSETMN